MVETHEATSSGWKAFCEDLAAYERDATDPPASRLALMLRVLLLPRLQAVGLFRLSQVVVQRSPGLAAVVRMVSSALTGSDLSPRAVVGGGLRLNHPVGVVVGPNCVVGARCSMMQGVTLGHGRGGSPVLGDDVFLGPHAVVIGGVQVASRVNVGANAVVSFPVPDGALVRAQKSSVVLINAPEASSTKQLS